MRVDYRDKSVAELVDGVRRRDSAAEMMLYQKCYKYFKDKVTMFPYLRSERVDDIFQESFLVIWTEIQNGKIFTNNGFLSRINKYGEASRMTCSLDSFLMAIARNRHLKELRTEGPAVLVDIDGRTFCGDAVDVDVTEKERRMQAIDDELAKLSHHCREILTLFYVKRMSLEQIMMSRPENTSKDGLKTSKSKCLRQLKTNVVRWMSYE